jgi:tRNA(fMet)-specific endonuclease VapC
VRVRRLGRGGLLEPMEPNLEDIKAIFAEIDRLGGNEFLSDGAANAACRRCIARSMICLDTNAVIAATNNRKPNVRRRLEAAIAGGTPVGILTIVSFELRYGIAKSARAQENTAILTAFLALNVTPWPFEPEDAQEAGEIRAELERAGRRSVPMMLIAAQARLRHAILVTANTGNSRASRGSEQKIGPWFELNSSMEPVNGRAHAIMRFNRRHFQNLRTA